MKMPFSPRRTKRPSESQVRSPAALAAPGFCLAADEVLGERPPTGSVPFNWPNRRHSRPLDHIASGGSTLCAIACFAGQAKTLGIAAGKQ
jgi:hypothetical protein